MRHGIVYALSLPIVAASAEQTVYPSAVGWVNVKTDYHAAGDGTTDDTEAIRRVLSTYPRQYHTKNVIFFPDGVYLVSDTLKFLDGYWDAGTTLQGQSRDGTIIRLADNAPGYGNASSPKPVIHTRAGNQSFAQYIRDLTIHTGSGPGRYSATARIKDLEKVVNGYTVGGIGDMWWWTDAWSRVGGDAWDMNDAAELYPFSVRVKVTFHQ